MSNVNKAHKLRGAEDRPFQPATMGPIQVKTGEAEGEAVRLDRSGLIQAS